ncbi:hypothetical protein [Roseofilum casamattae]|nr:hypothetical protein [Roseofilum casamattae]
MVAPHSSAIALLAALLMAIAIFSVQNATPISLKFLWLTSVPIPMGIIFTFSLCLGLLAGLVRIPSRSTPIFSSERWDEEEAD